MTWFFDTSVFIDENALLLFGALAGLRLLLSARPGACSARADRSPVFSSPERSGLILLDGLLAGDFQSVAEGLSGVDAVHKVSRLPLPGRSLFDICARGDLGGAVSRIEVVH